MMRRLLLLVALLPLAGCAAMAPVVPAASAGLLGWVTYKYETKNESEGMLRVSVKQAEATAMAAAKEMEITISDVKEKKEGEILLTGRGLKHEKIAISLIPMSRDVTKLSIKARRKKVSVPIFSDNKDIHYASEIYTRIQRKCRSPVVITAPAMKAMLETIHQGLIRKGPGPQYKIVVVVPSGAILFDLGQKKGSWHKVQTESGKIGFIYYTVVRPIKDIKFKDETDSKTM